MSTVQAASEKKRKEKSNNAGGFSATNANSAMYRHSAVAGHGRGVGTRDEPRVDVLQDGGGGQRDAHGGAGGVGVGVQGGVRPNVGGAAGRQPGPLPPHPIAEPRR